MHHNSGTLERKWYRQLTRPIFPAGTKNAVWKWDYQRTCCWSQDPFIIHTHHQSGRVEHKLNMHAYTTQYHSSVWTMTTIALHKSVFKTQPNSDLVYIHFIHSTIHSKKYNFVQRTWTQINSLQLLVVNLSYLCHPSIPVSSSAQRI